MDGSSVFALRGVAVADDSEPLVSPFASAKFRAHLDSIHKSDQWQGSAAELLSTNEPGIYFFEGKKQTQILVMFFCSMLSQSSCPPSRVIPKWETLYFLI
jgi:hypothetical protein